MSPVHIFQFKIIRCHSERYQAQRSSDSEGRYVDITKWFRCLICHTYYENILYIASYNPLNVELFMISGHIVWYESLFFPLNELGMLSYLLYPQMLIATRINLIVWVITWTNEEIDTTKSHCSDIKLISCKIIW